MFTEMPVKTLRTLLRYEPETGRLYWNEREGNAAFNGRFAGKEAFDNVLKGYRVGTVQGRRYRAHRVIWAINTGQWPKDQIDHIDHDRANNVMTNLRECSNRSNHQNMKLSAANTSGITGVMFVERLQKWTAFIMVDGVATNLGTFVAKTAAIAARKAAEVKHGFHENHGRAA